MRSATPLCSRHLVQLRTVQYGRLGSGGYTIQALRRCPKCAQEAGRKIALEKERFRNNKKAALYEGLS